MLRILSILWAFSLSNAAWAQLSELEATRIAETILSNQNPLVVVEEISHDGLFIASEGNGYAVVVNGPRLPGRDAFMEAMEFTLRPIDGDQVQVQITSLPQTVETATGGALTLRPTLFKGIFSRADRGFQSLQLGISDLVYVHPEATLSIGRFETDLRKERGVYELTIFVQDFQSDIQDTIDVKETAEAFTFMLSIDANQGNGGDLLFIANALLELITGPGQEDTNTLGKDRPLPADLMGLEFEVALEGLETLWLALMDQGARRTISQTSLGDVFIRGGIVPDEAGQARANINFGLNDIRLITPDSLVSGSADIFSLEVTMDGLDSRLISQLFSDADKAQTMALSRLIGGMSVLEVYALGKQIDLSVPSDEAFFQLMQGDFYFSVSSPTPDAPNEKDISLGLDLRDLRGDYPSETTALEPAWSAFVKPILPQVLDLNIDVSAFPGELWKGLAGIFMDTQAFPQDRGSPRGRPTLSLDGTLFQSELINARLNGGVTYNPDAQFQAVGEIEMILNNLRPLIGAMQRGARVENRTISQALTLGSIGLATIMSMAERTEDGQMRFVFDLGEAGLPKINGKDLPVRF